MSFNRYILLLKIKSHWRGFKKSWIEVFNFWQKPFFVAFAYGKFFFANFHRVHAVFYYFLQWDDVGLMDSYKPLVGQDFLEVWKSLINHQYFIIHLMNLYIIAQALNKYYIAVHDLYIFSFESINKHNPLIKTILSNK